MVVIHSSFTVANSKPQPVPGRGAGSAHFFRSQAMLSKAAPTATQSDSHRLTPRSIKCAMSPSQDGHDSMDHREKKAPKVESLGGEPHVKRGYQKATEK